MILCIVCNLDIVYYNFKTCFYIWSYVSKIIRASKPFSVSLISSSWYVAAFISVKSGICFTSPHNRALIVLWEIVSMLIFFGMKFLVVT